MRTDVAARGPEGSAFARASSRGARHFVLGVLGVLVLGIVWQIGTWYLVSQPETRAFGNFGPIPTFQAFPRLWEQGRIQSAINASLVDRLATGLFIAALIGIPLGILVGRSKWFREISHSPFQFIRMISPLAWMPLAVLVFPGWNWAIVYLIVIAAVWPVTYATAAGLAKLEPAWYKVARNLGASRIQILKEIVLPAIAFDMFSGLRLALGVAWIVLVPAELLGVTSGLGYAIKDARETVDYSYLTAMVLTIGVIGFLLDSIFVALINRYSWYHRRTAS
ncbi:MAG: ABC transporter permease [Betaproteobacteria bacterium]|nr:ABC transporter permease [Betaproteobacteria bacterium]